LLNKNASVFSYLSSSYLDNYSISLCMQNSTIFDT